MNNSFENLGNVLVFETKHKKTTWINVWVCDCHDPSIMYMYKLNLLWMLYLKLFNYPVLQTSK